LKIATFNIWNDENTWCIRREAIIEEAKSLNADIIAFQEVPNLQELKSIVKELGINQYSFLQYADDVEGLAILSKFPLEMLSNSKKILKQCAQRVIVDIKGLTLGVTNVHLDWKSALNREREIVEIVKWVSDSHNTDYELLCGDFNCTPNISSVYNFLVGEVSINSCETSWIDLAQSKNMPTLDFINNNWLHNRDNLNNIRVPVRYDWILLKSCFPKQEPKLTNIMLFGNKPTSKHSILPSDHYGVCVDLSFQNE
jgi:maltose 6'-phosphate phosphatase